MELGLLGRVAIVTASQGLGRRCQTNAAGRCRDRDLCAKRGGLEKGAWRINEMNGREVFWRTMDPWNGQVM